MRVAQSEAVPTALRVEDGLPDRTKPLSVAVTIDL